MNLQRWTRASNYLGPDWTSYYVFLAQTRDSDTIDRSNFTIAREALDKLPEFVMPDADTESRVVVRDAHWACGWVEWIAIHESDAAAIQAANVMMTQLENYPLLDEMHQSELEWNETMEWWERADLRDRIQALSKCSLSIFAARRAEFPQDDDGSLFQYCSPDRC